MDTNMKDYGMTTEMNIGIGKGKGLGLL